MSDIDKTSAMLSWKPPTYDGGSPLTGYLVEKREGRKPWARVDKISPDLTEYRVKSLTEGADYSFRVTPINKLGNGEALETEATIKPKSLFGKYSYSRSFNSGDYSGADIFISTFTACL